MFLTFLWWLISWWVNSNAWLRLEHIFWPLNVFDFRVQVLVLKYRPLLRFDQELRYKMEYLPIYIVLLIDLNCDTVILFIKWILYYSSYLFTYQSYLSLKLSKFISKIIYQNLIIKTVWKKLLFAKGKISIFFSKLSMFIPHWWISIIITCKFLRWSFNNKILNHKQTNKRNHPKQLSIESPSCKTC